MKKSLTYEDLMKGQKVLSYCVIAGPPVCETTTTDCQKLMVDLMSNKGENYKRLILSLLDNYSKVKGVTVENEMEKYNGMLALRLDEMELETLTINELQKIAKNLWIKNYMLLRKRELVKKIESVKKYFCNKNKE